MPVTEVLRSDYQKSVAAYWDNTARPERGDQQDESTWLLGEIDGLYHHHYGLGDYDRSVLERPGADPRRAHPRRAAPAGDRAGRPACSTTSATSARRPAAGRRLGPGCHELHGQRALRLPGRRRDDLRVPGRLRQRAGAPSAASSDRVRFHFRNMLDTGFETGSRRAIWTNETTMYVDLFDLFARVRPAAGGRRPLRLHHRLLERPDGPLGGGRPRSTSTTPATSTPAASTSRRWRRTTSSPIDGRRPHRADDPVLGAAHRTRRRRPASRSRSSTAYREGSFHYLLIVADRV